MAQRTSDVTAGPGGVMTDEVGVITGELTLRTEADDTSVRQQVQYRDADEWYSVTGSPTLLPTGSNIDTVHSATVARIAGGRSAEPDSGR